MNTRLLNGFFFTHQTNMHRKSKRASVARLRQKKTLPWHWGHHAASMTSVALASGRPRHGALQAHQTDALIASTPNPRTRYECQRRTMKKKGHHRQTEHTHTGGNAAGQYSPKPYCIHEKNKPQASPCASQEKGRFPSLHGIQAKTQPPGED